MVDAPQVPVQSVDLASFGWAPGMYAFSCRDVAHIPDRRATWPLESVGAKRCHRCQVCAQRKLDVYVATHGIQLELPF